MYPRLIALLLIAGALAAAATGASTPAQPAIVSATAHGISILVPGQPASVAAESTPPGTAATGVADGFVFPADGSLVRTGALSSSVSSRATGDAGAQAVSDVLGITLFNGEVTAESVAGRAKAGRPAPTPSGRGSRTSSSRDAGRGDAEPARAARDWGFLVALEQVAEAPVADGDRERPRRGQRPPRRPHRRPCGAPRRHRDPRRPRRGGGIHRHRGADRDDDGDHDPRRAGSTRGRAAEDAEAAAEAARAGRAAEQAGLGLPIPPTDVSAPLSPKGYVFPVYGPSSFTDTFRAGRAGVGWHHGEDIFAPLGAPLLAVAEGTVFSVGWNDLGGYRLWLRDRQGNQFYYAHLSAFSPLAVDGNEVKAGDVIGFVGNTGDAQTTPYHLHFEIHPVGLLPLGYDGVVNAFPYLARGGAPGHHLRRRARLGAARSVERDRAPAGGVPARLDRHLERQRPRPQLAGPRAHRPGLPGRRRHARSRLEARAAESPGEFVLAGGV